MITCHIFETGQPVGECGLGRAEFAHLPRPRDRLRLALPGAVTHVYEVVAVEHVGVHESTDRSAPPADWPDPMRPATEAATVLHVQKLDAEAGAYP